MYRYLVMLALLLAAPAAHTTPINAGGGVYVAECLNAGVPTPPDWGSPLWRPNGTLAWDFIGGGSTAEVYFYESETPRGVCIALPRWNGTETSLLGIICQGNDSSKACFWDNDHRPGSKSRVIRRGETVPLGEFLGGADLDLPGQVDVGGRCTSCHAGENAFVIHPGTALDRGRLGTITKPKNFVDPLVHPEWPQNPGPTTLLDGIKLDAGDGSCLACHGATGPAHRLPAVSTELAGYCSAVLENAIALTMPPGNPGDRRYAKHIDALREACKQPPSPPRLPAWFWALF